MIKNGVGILVFFLVFSVKAYELPSDMLGEVNRAIEEMIKCDFRKAFSITDSLAKENPESPLPPLVHLFIMGLKDLDRDHITDEEKFMSLYQKTLENINIYEKEKGRDSYSLTLAGFADAVHAGFYLYQGKYFSATGTGKEAMELLQRAREEDKENYDALYFLGFYNYARGELKRRLWMVLFWYPGKREKGIEMLEECASKGLITSEAAKLVLADVYSMEEDYGKAEAMIDELWEKYPGSRFVLWSRAKLYERRSDYSKAAEAYYELSKDYSGVKQGGYNYLSTLLKAVDMYKESGDEEMGKRVAEDAFMPDCSGPVHDDCSKMYRDIKREVD